jgi:F0F1-type ATP synthase membrane subunit c/vacuolar-type H+-ATPase subunit K
MELLAETVNTAVIAKGILVGFGGMGPAIAIGLMGSAYMSAVSRNPESSKFLGQLFIFVGMAEVFGLIAFASIFIVE